jgi:hypothetical protein
VLDSARRRAQQIIDQAEPLAIPVGIDRQIRDRFPILDGQLPAS